MQTNHDLSTFPRRYRGWITRGVVGIVVATFFSDVGHEMATATLPLYLGSIGLGAAALGLIEGLADLLFSLSKLAGGWVDRGSKLGVLVFGYGLGVITNGRLAFSTGSQALLVMAIVLSGVYIAIEETLEKAVAAEMLARNQRSIGLGVLAAANAGGDMLSSVGIGLLIATQHTKAAFLIAATFGFAGVVWMLFFMRQDNGYDPMPR